MANLFSDSFESGNFNSWSDHTNFIDSGDLSVATAAKIHGSYGLNCLINDTTTMYLIDTTPNDKTYRSRFYININSLSMTNNDEIQLLKGLSSGSQLVYVSLKYTTASHYIIYASIRDDATNYAYINANNVGDGIHCVEVYWKAATGVGANNGILQLWIDGTLITGSISNEDNDTRTITDIQFGCCGAKPAGTSGTFYLDDFVSNNDGGLIGSLTVATLGGTVTTAAEADIVVGGKTIILTLTDDIWVAAGGTFDSQRQNIINGLTSAQSETHGWNAEVKAKIAVTDVVRTSNTVVTITLDAEAGYDITANETITVTIPISALLNTATAIVASPTFNITTNITTNAIIGRKTLLGVGV